MKPVDRAAPTLRRGPSFMQKAVLSFSVGASLLGSLVGAGPAQAQSLESFVRNPPAVVEVNAQGQQQRGTETRTAATDQFTGTATTRVQQDTTAAPLQVRQTNPVTQEDQQRTLQALMQRGQQLISEGKAPVLMLDLDLTTLMPTERSVAAMKAMAQQIPEFADPQANFAFIPGYTTEAWNHFLDANPDLVLRYPDLRNSSRLPNYWGAAPLETDQVTPGTVELIRAWEEMGGKVMFGSGRSGGWEEGSREALRRGGLPNVDLRIGNIGGDAETKATRTREVEQERDSSGRPYVLAAVVDDREANRNAAKAASVDSERVLSISIAIPGYSWAPDVAQNPLRVSTFEMGGR